MQPLIHTPENITVPLSSLFLSPDNLPRVSPTLWRTWQHASRGEIADDFPVAIALRDEVDATMVSLTENVERKAMHPADEFEASQSWPLRGIASTASRIHSA